MITSRHSREFFNQKEFRRKEFYLLNELRIFLLLYFFAFSAAVARQSPAWSLMVHKEPSNVLVNSVLDRRAIKTKLEIN